MTRPHDEMLEDLFFKARSDDPVPSDDLIARILTDADAEQSGFAAPVVLPKGGLWAGLLDSIGGWPSLSGIAAATVAGVWIGVAPPAGVEDFSANLIGEQVSVSLFSGELGFETGALIDG